MAAALPIFSSHDRHNNLCFDPLMDYAQALAEEAQKQQNQESSEMQGTCLSPERSSKEISSSKRRRSWKSSLCSWRRPWTKKQKQKYASSGNSNSGIAGRIIPAAKQQSFKYKGGQPITMAEAQCYSRSGPVAAMLGAAVNREFPYLPLIHSHSRADRCPVYLIT